LLSEPPTLSPGAPPVVGVVVPIPSGAGFWIRALARIVDVIYGIVLGFIMGIGLGIIFAILAHMGKIDADWAEHAKRQNSLLGYLLGIIGSFSYHSVSEGMGGLSVGKLVCGLRVVRADGDSVDLEAGLLRSLAYFWDALFFGVIGYTRMERGVLRQRYGDAWAGTVVVRNSIYQSPNPPSAGRSFVAVVLGSILSMGLSSIPFIVSVL